MLKLSGKVAVVTGAASGIGLAMSQRFAAEGMCVVMADIDRSALSKAHRDLSDSRARVLAVPTDVSEPQDVESLAVAARVEFGAVHVICNNAGVLGRLAPAWEASLEDWQSVIDVNLWGVIHGIRTFVPIFIKQGIGHVVNTSSVAGWSASPAMCAYGASKHAVLGISEALHKEVGLLGVDVGVSVLCPPSVNTRLVDHTRWPSDVSSSSIDTSDSLTSAARSQLIRNLAIGDSAETVAEGVLRGIEDNQFLITTDPQWVERAAVRRVDIARGSAPHSSALR